MGMKGSAEVRYEGQGARLAFGQTLLLPAAVGPCEIVPDGEAVVLTCVLP